ncbi:tetratricopeptide repeat protein [Geobacter sp. SVR]|uniref:tetratricopeptide repeat protein n=1 Tax=Geobacter sp. SVR TaxID=2495594 RepID=UPI00143EFB19|nr:tetratricopeptide repeat protein [Geobacter sp. SVR]BCS55621.1 hypothetical protein GSVR_39290 [Geobacter sp. SVR]GCF83624.1 hypothetical protein GSbR_02240 [Geobacter sp. SVR]
MDPHTGVMAERDFVRALKELDDRNVLTALACLERALAVRDDPHWYSRLGFCIAKERGHVTRGIELCNAALEHEPEDAVHHLYLGKIHLLAGQKNEALQVFRQGMAVGGNPEIEAALKAIGTRKRPVISFLPRDNPLNKHLGILLARLGIR